MAAKTRKKKRSSTAPGLVPPKLGADGSKVLGKTEHSLRLAWCFHVGRRHQKVQKKLKNANLKRTKHDNTK
ncbi:hypothetical protein A2U01_0059487, partial [Trifolium medium]|nr:hypothetical protein [Trifolium medium]